MKKLFYALLLSVFVLSISVGTADAAWTSSFTTAKKILSNANATTLASQSAAGAIAYTLGAGETLNTNDVIVVTLTGGAKFSSTAPRLKTTLGTAFASIVGSATGATSANFRADTSSLIPTDVILLTVEDTIFDVSAVTGNVDINFTATTSVGGLTIFNANQSSKTGAAYAFSAPSASESVTIVASTNVADVSATTGAFKKFTGATLTGTAAGFSVTNLCDDNTVQTVPSGQEISIGKILFNISGELTGITSVSGTGCTGSSSAGAITGGTTNFFLIDTAKTNAYCVNTAALAPITNLALAPIFTIDGTTAQTARGFNAAVSVLADGTKWAAHTALSPTALYAITRNGSSFVTNSVGPRNTIKITDRSNGVAAAGGSITITAYDASGVALTEVAGAPALLVQNNATTTITGTDLAARFTGTAMRYDFAVESSSIVVANVKASVDGTMSATTIFTTAPATATGIAQGI